MSYLEYSIRYPDPSLESAQSIAKEALGDFATSPNFLANLETAFGSDLDFEKAAELAAAWGAGDFSGLPEIEVRPSNEINGAMGAFSTDTNTIYFSQEYLSANAGSDEAVAAVWLEEIGHFVDSVVNSQDAAGDEGDIFSRLVRGDVLSALELELLKSEDDGAVVVLDGVEVAIEMAALKFSTPVSGELTKADNSDTHTFRAKEGDIMLLNVVGPEIVPQVEVFRPDGTLLSSFSQPSPSLLEITGPRRELELPFSPDVSGTYTIVLKSLPSNQLAGYSQTGNYNINLELINNPAKQATPLKFGLPISASIDKILEHDKYSFTAQVGDRILLEAGEPDTSSSDIAPQVHVYNPDGFLLGISSGSGGKIFDEVTPLIDGTYTLVFSSAASSSEGQTGDYTISVECTGECKAKPEPPKPTNRNDKITGTSRKDTIDGKDGNDQINGRGGNDRLQGGIGNDRLDGGTGKDRLNGGIGNDRLDGGKGADILNGGGGKDTLIGGGGNDNLIGGAGRDKLLGGGGNDRLTGSAGNDTLTGGGGRDRFIYETNRRFRRADFGVDRITDFVAGQDDIVLDKTTFTSLESTAGNRLIANDFAIITDNANAATSNAEIVYNSSNGQLFYNANGSAAGFGGGGRFAILTNEAELSRTDFIVQN
ncbi:calcium-binding protein [Okeania sp. KiyG1]|uniref:calcium-binding protein n=1 Tax=Okeania sp. KiyG1 TaxID=2720165 RepID=UPI001920AB69|nr:calcium-binding protein [Okeania sp. KiyG1]GGA59294.1 hypothetical protein CYANOKiyG1_80750 [Okeania sp. KiyG1]